MVMTQSTASSQEQQLQLACAELADRLRAGESCRAEEYFDRYPVLRTSVETALELVYTEYVTGLALGRTSTAADWIRRFPAWEGELRQLFEVHAVFPAVRPRPKGKGGRLELPRQLAGYTLTEVLGTGAFGTVYKAWDTHLHRTVAIKVAHGGSIVDERRFFRFQREARSLAQLRHPAIVRIYEWGEAEGCVYLVCDYISGSNLAKRIESGRLSFDEAASVVARIADALQYAHDNKVVHRDVKPSNILVDESDTVYLTDFGLALRPGEESTLTSKGQMLGTPGYMSPEQARGESHQADGRSDVYSLGVVLYELLTGERPFRGELEVVVQQILNVEPRPPQRVDKRVPIDLETICLKCLEKKKEQRYPDARELGDDLRRYLERKPVLARRVGRAERAVRWAGRNRELALATAVAAVLLLALLLSTTIISLAWANDANKQAKSLKTTADSLQTALEESENRRAEGFLDRGLAEAENGEVSSGLLLMARALETLPERNHELARPIRTNLTTRGRQAFALAACATPPPVSADQGLVLTLCPQVAWMVAGNPKQLRRWEITPGAFVGRALEHSRPVTAAVVDATGKQVFTGCDDGTVHMWDVSRESKQYKFRATEAICYLALSADGRALLVGSLESADGKVRTALQVIDVETGSARGTPFSQAGRVKALALSPDAKTALVVQQYAKEVDRWDVATGRFLGSSLPHPGVVHAVAFSPDGETVLTGSEDRTARVWDLRSSRQQAVLYHREPVWAVAFSPSGQVLWTASPGDAVRIWSRAASPEPLQTLPHSGAVRVLALSPDGKHAVTGGARVAKLWKASAAGLVSERELPHASPLLSGVFSPNGQLLITTTYLDPFATVWQVESGRQMAKLTHTGPVRMAAFNLDGSLVATASSDRTVQVWNTTTLEPAYTDALRHEGPATAAVFSPDGKLLITASEDRLARIWGATSGRRLGLTGTHNGPVVALAVSADSQLLLTASLDGTARSWYADTGKPFGPALLHGYALWSIALNSDGRTVVTGSRDNTARLWDVQGGERPGGVLLHSGPVWSTAFSPDGRSVLTSSEDGTARLWDVATGRTLGPAMKHAGLVNAAVFEPDSRWVATAGHDAFVRVWPLPVSHQFPTPLMTLWAQVLTGMELDPAGGVVVLSGREWRARKARLFEVSPVPGPVLPVLE